MTAECHLSAELGRWVSPRRVRPRRLAFAMSDQSMPPSLRLRTTPRGTSRLLSSSAIRRTETQPLSALVHRASRCSHMFATSKKPQPYFNPFDERVVASRLVHPKPAVNACLGLDGPVHPIPTIHPRPTNTTNSRKWRIRRFPGSNVTTSVSPNAFSSDLPPFRAQNTIAPAAVKSTLENVKYSIHYT
jgi:hypothetical protein